MRKLTGGVIVGVFLLCAFTAQAQEPVDVFDVNSEPMAMTVVICSSDSDCASGAECQSAKVCVDDITSVPTGATCTTNDDCDVGSSCQEMSICVGEAGCASDADCAGNPDGEICNLSTGQCVECLADDNCTGNPSGGLCDLDTNTCVECFTDSDCADSAFCELSTCVPFEDCDLRVKPVKVKISGKKKKPYIISLLRIKGNENFVTEGSGNACSADSECASGEECRKSSCEIVIDFDLRFVEDPDYVPDGPFDTRNQIAIVSPNGIQARKRLLKVRIAAGTELETGLVPVRVGKCSGEFELQ